MKQAEIDLLVVKWTAKLNKKCTASITQRTIMIRDGNRWPDPIWAPVKPKSPEHAPA